MVAESKEKLNIEVRRQEKLNMAEERDFRRRELSERYTVKMLYRWKNGKMENLSMSI